MREKLSLSQFVRLPFGVGIQWNPPSKTWANSCREVVCISEIKECISMVLQQVSFVEGLCLSHSEGPLSEVISYMGKYCESFKSHESCPFKFNLHQHCLKVFMDGQ